MFPRFCPRTKIFFECYGSPCEKGSGRDSAVEPFVGRRNFSSRVFNTIPLHVLPRSATTLRSIGGRSTPPSWLFHYPCTALYCCLVAEARRSLCRCACRKNTRPPPHTPEIGVPPPSWGFRVNCCVRHGTCALLSGRTAFVHSNLCTCRKRGPSMVSGRADTTKIILRHGLRRYGGGSGENTRHDVVCL